MANYLLALGGTGSKVLEAFVHLSAAGVVPHNTHIALIDQDEANGNIARVKSLVETHGKISLAMASQTASVEQAGGLFTTRLPRPAILPLKLEQEAKPTLLEICRGDPDFAVPGSVEPRLLDCLFSKAEQNLTLEEGFRGLPSIGSLVFAGQEFAADAGEGSSDDADEERTDRKVAVDLPSLIQKIVDSATAEPVKILLIGSIYGGTGASGFPTLARLISRKLKDKKDVVLGGVLCLPYFAFAAQPEAERRAGQLAASSDNFIHQSVDALPYYERLLEREAAAFSQLYVVGSDPLFALNYFDAGGRGQENPPLVPELYAALFAQHFFSNPAARSEKSVWHVGCGQNEGGPPVVKWSDLPDPQGDLRSRLGSMMRFCATYHYQFHHALTGGSNGGPLDAARGQAFMRTFLTPFDSSCRQTLLDVDSYCEAFLLYFGRMGRFSAAGREFAGLELFSDQFFMNHGESKLLPTMPAEQMPSLVRGLTARRDPAMPDIVHKLNRARKPSPAKAQPVDFLEALYAACKI